MKNAKECNNDTKCMLQSQSIVYTYLNTSDTWASDRTDTRKLILTDGTYVVIDSNVQSTCSRRDSYGQDYCAWIGVDLNGPKKPNKFGRDAFIFILSPKGLYAAGCLSNCSLGGDCTCRVLRENAINY